MADDQAQPPVPPPPPDSDGDIRVPEPRVRRRTPARAIVFSLFGTLFALVLIVSGLAIWGYSRVMAPGPLNAARAVIIERGTGNEDVAALLEKEGIVENAREFLTLIWLTRPHAPIIKAGEYAFAPHISMRDALALIRSGHSVTYKLTLPEGWTSARILERIRAQSALSGEITKAAPEGSLLPDTYLYQRGTERDEMITRIQAARDRLLKDLWAKRAKGLPLKTPQEAVTLASIVEKETGIAEERPRVAAVFINRLKRHMRLQSDPTIIYGITEGKSRLDRPLTRSDIAEKTPYNTYQIDGLPPTPIANPGRDALAAVLNPVKSDELYFVADGTGGHVFASNLKQHMANVKHWRQVERDQREADTSSPDAPVASNDTPANVAQVPQAPAQQSPAADRSSSDISGAPLTPPSPTPLAERPNVQAEQTAKAPDKPQEPAQQPPATAEAPKPETFVNDLHIPTTKPSPEPTAQRNEAPTPPANVADVAEITNIEPGKIITIAGRLVPLPRPRPPR